MRINPQEFQSFPKQLVIGFVPATSGMAHVQQALDTSGVAGNQVTS